MKVLQVFKTYYPDSHGGIEAVIDNLCSETQKLGVDNTLLTLSANPYSEQYHSLKVVRCKKNFEIASCPLSLSFLCHFKTMAREADLLHFHYPWPFADLSYLLRKVDRPALVTFHADALKNRFLKTLYTPLQKQFFKKIQFIVPTSTPLMQSSSDLENFQDKCRVIPIGINPHAHRKTDENAVKNLHAQFGKRFALFVGVLRHYKGLQTLLEAAKYIDLPILIAGAGPLHSALAAEIDSAKLSNIHLLGRVSETEKSALYEACSMVILPSNTRAEAFGVSLLEGLMHKKPLISTELGTGTSFVNQDQRTGFVIPPNDALALIEAIKKLELHSLAEKMGKQGYDWFLENFQSAIMGQRYFNLYQELLA